MNRLLAAAVLAASLAAPSAGAAPPPAELSRAREEATLAGEGFLQRFLSEPARRRALGGDGVLIFFELGLTSRNADLRRSALRVAARFASERVGVLLEPGALLARESILGAVFLLPVLRDLGLPFGELLARTASGLESCGDDAAIYGADVDHLERLSSDELFDLLIDIYAMERAAARFGVPFERHTRLGLFLAFVTACPFAGFAPEGSPGRDRFTDDAYLATHVAFVLSDFGRLPLSVADLGAVLPYLRREFASVLADGDVDLVAEFVDVFRSLGATDEGDSNVRDGTIFLLSRQRPDGSFSLWETEEEPYDAVHPTWVAVDALRDRTFSAPTPYAARLRRILGHRATPPAVSSR